MIRELNSNIIRTKNQQKKKKIDRMNESDVEI